MKSPVVTIFHPLGKLIVFCVFKLCFALDEKCKENVCKKHLIEKPENIAGN